MAGQLWLRFLLLCLAPVLALLLGNSMTLLAVTCVGSLAAAGFDVLRQKRRCLPFPIYLLLVYALQTYSFLAIPQNMSGTGSNLLEGFRGEHPASPRSPESYGVAAAGAQAHPVIETMSVVIAAHNEHKYMKRTLDSIYGSTPSSVLKEIIVVDDASSPPLASTLGEYKQVKIIRHEDRRGLIKSKTEGGNLATSDMIMFLDGHVKPEKDWWKPILKHMNTNYKRVVVPVIPILDGETWEPNLHAIGVKMMFDWTLFFQWFEDYNDLVPCMSGGLFGITRLWWHESGEYDYGMAMWGAENIEQSIRVWLCGGEIYVARDSRVSHVFRTAFPYKINNTEIYINKVRTVETWFDDYKQRYYDADPAAKQFVRYYGNISDRLALKKRLGCKPFQWYVDKFRQVFLDKHMLPEFVWLFRDKSTGLCLQVGEQSSVQEAECNADEDSQQWIEANGGSGLRNRGVDKCLDANAGLDTKTGAPVFLYNCFTKNDQQVWSLSHGHIRWKDHCVQGKKEGNLVLMKCSDFLQASGNFEVYARHAVTGPGQL